MKDIYNNVALLNTLCEGTLVAGNAKMLSIFFRILQAIHRFLCNITIVNEHDDNLGKSSLEFLNQNIALP